MHRLTALTVRGRAFLAAGVAATACSLVIGQTDLLRVGVFLLALPLVALVAVARTRYRLSVQREVDPPRVAVGETATVRVELSNLARIPTGLIMAEEQVPYVLGRRPRFVLERVPARWTRELTYAVACESRGVVPLGPLSLRLADPFGLVELTRSFRSTALLTVTPAVVALPSLRLRGEWSGSGESRPRAVATAGEEDATIREYRDGDDLRRVHWRATAHHDRLMVRREEQPWQSRCTVLLDNRVSGHAGRGTDSSFEFAVTAAASLGVHQLRRGYAVRLVTDDGADSGATWHDSGRSTGSGDGSLLDALAVVRTSREASIGSYPAMLTGAGGSPGLLVAVLGDLRAEEAGLMARLRHGSSTAIAMVLDTSSWPGGTPQTRVDHLAAVATLRGAGWRVVSASRGDDLGMLWQRVAERGFVAPPAPTPTPRPSGASVAEQARTGDAA